MFLIAADALHQREPVDESVLLQLKDSEEMADINPAEALQIPCCPWRYLTHFTLCCLSTDAAKRL